MSLATKNGPLPPELAGQRGLEPVLVIGAHREELSFGERVAEGLDPRIDVLRIPVGISGHWPRPDEVFYYETRHRELYLQLRQQVRGRYKLVIDLHRGINQAGRCADVYSRDAELLQCVQHAAKGHYGSDMGASLVQVVRLASRAEICRVNSTAHPASPPAGPFGKTVIPAGVWDSNKFLYVGIEIYLACDGQGDAEDWSFARRLVLDTVRCAS